MQEAKYLIHHAVMDTAVPVTAVIVYKEYFEHPQTSSVIARPT
jgi:hypothetical protein